MIDFIAWLAAGLLAGMVLLFTYSVVTVIMQEYTRLPSAPFAWLGVAGVSLLFWLGWQKWHMAFIHGLVTVSAFLLLAAFLNLWRTLKNRGPGDGCLITLHVLSLYVTGALTALFLSVAVFIYLDGEDDAPAQKRCDTPRQSAPSAPAPQDVPSLDSPCDGQNRIPDTGGAE